MIELNKNGSFLERRKMFVEQPYHNMKSRVRIDWQNQYPTPQQQRRYHQDMLEHAYIQKIYNQRVTKKIQDIQPVNTYRVISSQIPRRQQDVLSHQLALFNKRRLLQMQQQPPRSIARYASLQQIQQPTKKEVSIQVQKVQQVKPMRSLEQIYAPKKQIENPNIGLMYLYRQSANRVKSMNPEQSSPLSLPDNLTPFLRQKVVRQRRHRLNLSLNHAKNGKIAL